uniref:Uncharacterized protein n=1 Tax=Arundo donax TaxID=35708 RepID=A0A0A9GYG3_ARUDO
MATVDLTHQYVTYLHRTRTVAGDTGVMSVCISENRD